MPFYVILLGLTLMKLTNKTHMDNKNIYHGSVTMGAHVWFLDFRSVFQLTKNLAS